jgi:DNA-binding XRE family transcriptional regulator
MPRPTDPSSERQVRERAKRMRGPWTEQVLRNLAGAVLQATRWRAWETAGGAPGPDDSPSSWPRLPDTPGERVELGITRLDMSTPEGWEAARELMEQPRQWDTGEQQALQERITLELADALEHSPQLSASFYSSHSLRAGEMLLQRTLPVTVLAGPYQSLWRKPEHPLGLPPADHPASESLVGHEETAALEQVAWEAARELYRSLGNPQPDEHGRRGLERPEELRRWGERLGLVEPDGTVAVGPLGDEDAHRVATGLPWSKAQATLLSPRIQAQGEGLPPGHLHRSRTAMSPTRGGHETLVSVAEHSSALEADPQAWAHLQKAQQLLETHGPEMARLSLYLSMHVCGRPDPLAPFLVQGEDLLEDFGLVSTSGGRGRTAVLERSTRLKHQAELARALDLVTVQAKDYLGPADKNGRRPFRRFTGRLWQVESLELGTESQLTLGAEVAQDPEEVVTTLRLLVRPGSWVQMYPTQAQEPGAQLWYGHVATAVLRLSHQRNQLAACLGLYLSTALVEQKARLSEGRREFLVGSLLERVTVARELELAKTDRRYGERLRSSWVAALDVLHHLVGFRFTFCRDTYPAWAVPESLLGDREPWEGPAPHGALEQLLKGHLTVGWPAPVLEAATNSKAAASSEALAAQVRSPRVLASSKPARGKPNGTLLKEARQAAGLTQRSAAGVLGLSQGQLCKLEGGLKALPRTELDRHLEQLVEHSRRERFNRATQSI